MSRIGRMPIAIPDGVTVTIAENNQVTVKGPKGTLERVLPAEMDIKQEGSEIIVTRPNDLKKMKSLHGLTRTLIHNMVVGVTAGYEKTLEVNGVGYLSLIHIFGRRLYPWQKDIDPKLKEREMHRKIPDLQQNYHMLECLYRKLASYWMQSVAKM